MTEQDLEDPAGAVTVLFDPSCPRCMSAEKILTERGIEARYIDYVTETPTVEALRRLLEMLDASDAREIVRTAEPLWSQLGLAGASADQILRALARHPELIQRPIVIKGGRAVIARPPERVLEVLSAPGSGSDARASGDEGCTRGTET